MRLRTLCLAAAVCTLFACGQSRPVPEGPSLLLVTFDTTRADYLGCYGFDEAHTPQVDRLAADGILYEHCTSPAPITLPSHSSMLTGLYPDRHGARNNGTYTVGEEKTTLAELLYDAGYDTGAFVSAYVLDGLYGLNQGFEVYDDHVRDSTVVTQIEERRAAVTTDAAIAWLTDRKDKERPFFAWVHYFDPHQAYLPPSPWAEQFADDLYSGEIAYADDQLGRLLEAVDLDNTLVVMTADHGESLGEHGEQTHAFFVYNSTLHVPLIVRYPDKRRAGTRVADQVSLVDIAPTLLKEAGLEVPSEMEGIDLQDAEAVTDPQRWVYFESTYPLSFDWSPLAGISTPEWKFIQAPQPELYHRGDDPKELNNVIDEHSVAAVPLRGKLERRDPFADLVDSANQKQMTAEEREIMAALGYVGGTLTARHADPLSLPDPKEKIGQFNRYLLAKQAYSWNLLPETKGHLDEILVRSPDMILARQLLGRVLTDMGRPEEAAAVLDRALESRPEDSTLWYAIAVAYNNYEDYARAAEKCREGLQLFPDEPGLWDQLGVAELMLGNTKEAVQHAKKAVELSEQPEYVNNLGMAFSAAGDRKNARKNFERVLELQPDYVPALFNLGVLAMKDRDYDDAEEILRRTVLEKDSHYDAWAQLNKALLYQDKTDEALTISKRLLEMDPANPSPHYFRYSAHRQREDYAEAEEALRAYLNHNRGFGPGYVELCEVLLAQGPAKRDEAKQTAKQAVALGSELPPAVKKEVGL